MEYNEIIEYLYNQLPTFQVIGAGAYKPGLATARALDAAFGNPSQKLKCLHVAGTNGKGSTSHALASVLMAAGYKVGLYTSPHLADFRERIRVNGQKIPKQSVVDFMERYLAQNLRLQPSFFELTTIMAFDYFVKAEVDYAVIEVGLGGRLDTTNIINPIISIITNISLDHTSLLGDTIGQIAAEKAGIIKPGIPAVISEANGAVRAVMQERAESVGAPIVFAEDRPFPHKSQGDKHWYACQRDCQPDIESDLRGEWQSKNINAVLTALEILQIVDDQAIKVGLEQVQKSTGLMGRWTVMQQNPTVVFDTGHNPGAWQYLAPKLSEIAKKRTTRIVIGFANDKDVESIFAQLPIAAEYYFVAPNVPRARSAHELQALGERYKLVGKACESVRAGLEAAIKASTREDFVFAGGSNFVIAELVD